MFMCFYLELRCVGLESYEGLTFTENNLRVKLRRKNIREGKSALPLYMSLSGNLLLLVIK